MDTTPTPDAPADGSTPSPMPSSAPSPAPSAAAGAPGDDLARQAALIANTDVAWDGTLVGLVPRLAGPTAQVLQVAGGGALPAGPDERRRALVAALVAALDDPARDVAAHVLLTLLTGMDPGVQGFNGLQVLLSADGRSSVPPGQQAALARRWRQWQAAPVAGGALPP